MPYDPNFPLDDVLIESLPFRNQFHGIMDAVDAINAVNAATVDGVNTVNPGDPAQASVSVSGNTLRFTFSIPKGNDGGQGTTGDTGAQGPPFAQAIIDAVNTLNPNEPATVQVGFDGTNVHFTFSIPRGEIGGTGDQGIQGPPGEVTNADLSAAISGTSANTNAVSTLDTPFADPDAETMRQAYNALVLGLRRP